MSKAENFHESESPGQAQGEGDISDLLTTLVLDNDKEEFENPFKWNMHVHIPEQGKQELDWMVKRITEKLNCAVDDQKVFKWYRYIKLLVLIYEYTVRNEGELALQCLKTCEAILLEPQNTFDPFYKSIEKALWHVFYATQLKLITDHHVDLHVDAAQLTRKITPLNQMSDDEKAGVLGIKTAVFMNYGSLAGSYMLETIRKAIQLSPKQGEWHYKEGIILGRFRKFQDSFDSDRNLQFESFKRAFDLNPDNASYVMKYAKEMRHKGVEMGLKGDETYNAEVLRLLQKVVDLRPECPYTIVKVTKDLAQVPHYFSQLIQELLLRAEEKAPNYNLLHLYLGRLYLKSDRQKACEYFRRGFEDGHMYGSAYIYIKTKLRIDPDFNPIPVLEKARDENSEESRKAESIIHIGCYYLFIKDDVDKAMDQFAQVLDQYPESSHIKKFKPVCLDIDRAVSLLELLHNCLNKEHHTALRRDEILEKVYKFQPDLEQEPTYRHYWNEAQWARIVKKPRTSNQGRYNDRQNYRERSCDRDSNWRQSRGVSNSNRTEGRTSGGSNEQGRRNDWGNLRQRRNDDNSREGNGNDNRRQMNDSYNQRQSNQRQRNNSGRHRDNTSPAREGSWRR